MALISKKEKALLEAVITAYAEESNPADRILKTEHFVAVVGVTGKLVAELGLADGKMFANLQVDKSYSKEDLGLQEHKKIPRKGYFFIS